MNSAVAEPDLEMALELCPDEELTERANEIILEINRPAFNYWDNIPVIPGSTYLMADHVDKALFVEVGRSTGDVTGFYSQRMAAHGWTLISEEAIAGGVMLMFS